MGYLKPRKDGTAMTSKFNGQIFLPGQRRAQAVATLLTVSLACLCVAAQAEVSGDDLRDLRVGRSVEHIRVETYKNIRCIGTGPRKGTQIDSLAAFRSCDDDANGVFEMSLQYASDPRLVEINDRYDGTKLAGHPVLLTLAVKGTGIVQHIGVRSDPTASAYMRRKAFLLAARVKSQYGVSGWNCLSGEPRGDFQAVGVVFIDETCDKLLIDRRLTLSTRFYRQAGRPDVELINETRFDVELLESSPS